MKTKHYILSLILCPFVLNVLGQTQNEILKNALDSKTISATSYSFAQKIIDYKESKFDLQKSTFFQVNENEVSTAFKNATEFVEFSIPLGDQELTLVGRKVNVFSPDAKIVNQHGVAINFDLPLSYRGFLKNDPTQLVSFVISNNEIEGSVFTTRGSITFGPLRDGSKSKVYVSYNEKDLNLEYAGCQADDSGISDEEFNDFNEKLKNGIPAKSNKCVAIGAEVDSDLRGLFPNDQTCINFVIQTFNQVEYLFEEEGINVLVNHVVIWHSISKYVGTNAVTYLESFFDLSSMSNSDVYMLMSAQKNFGGAAFINQLCKAKPYAFAGMDATYATAPTFSNTVNIMTHELGHVFGSRHTHHCNWPGGAIDNCAPPEGPCSTGIPPVGGGTIMSYCQNTLYGVNFNNGFGQLPGDKIRSSVDVADCLKSCDVISELGLTENQQINALVYPNPSTGNLLNIESEIFFHGNTQIAIISLDGRLVYSEEVNNQNSKYTIEIGHLNAGSYLLNMTSPSGETFIVKWT